MRSRPRILPGLAMAAAAAALHGDRMRIDHRFPFVEVTALRPYLTVAAAATSAALASRRSTRRAGLVLGALAGAALPDVVRRVRARPLAEPHPDELTVLALNVWHGRADTGALATLLERERPDLVALSEAGCDYRDKLMPLIESMGYRSWCSIGPGEPDGSGVVVLAAQRLGDLDVSTGPEMRRRYLRATGGALGARSFLAVHTDAPTSPAQAQHWHSDLRHLAWWSHEPATPIIAGDLNATVDHAALRDVLGPCRSAAEGTGRGLVATFPTSARTQVPRWAGIQIDHVLVPTGATVSRFDVVDVPGTDHRGVLTRVRLPKA